MDNRRAEFASHDISVLFLVGAVGGMSDEQLLEKFAAESEADRQIAFEAIVRRHGPMVLGVCRRILRHEQDAEDAFQATFMVLALRAGMVRKRKSLGPWLHGVAARIARRAQLVTRQRQEQPIPPDVVEVREEGNQSVADFEKALDIEVSRLPEKYRLPIVLCYLEGKTQNAAAHELGWPKGTVSGRLARCQRLAATAADSPRYRPRRRVARSLARARDCEGRASQCSRVVDRPRRDYRKLRRRTRRGSSRRPSRPSYATRSR